MRPIDTNTLKEIIDLLAKFLERKSDLFLGTTPSDPTVFHYYTEIIRYWNKLNFILRKTLRALEQLTGFDKTISPDIKAVYFYITYRIISENVSIDLLLNELAAKLTFFPDNIKLTTFLKKLLTFNWGRAMEGKSELDRLSLEEAIPSFVIDHLRPVMSLDFLQKNLHFMNEFTGQADIIIRVNTLSPDGTDSNLTTNIQQDLKHQGIRLQQDSNVPYLFHVPAKNKSEILQTKWYQSGQLIFQDKGSAGVVEILDPQPHNFICDMCAAPGLKTSLIAQKTDNSARILAVDFQLRRVNEMKQLLRDLHVVNTPLLNADSFNLPIRSNYQFDQVLLDAPCTGSGTFLTNPTLKWRQNNYFLQQNTSFQEKLLDTALKILKPQGILVYATCSLYPEEGEFQIVKFLERLKPLEVPPWLSPSYKINNSHLPGTGRLFPAVHHSQGFFIAKFEKKG